MVTRKNNVEFEKWYELNDCEYDLILFDFYTLPFEMQIGVYLAYYDSKGFYIGLSYALSAYLFEVESRKESFCSLSGWGGYKTRIEAYKAALKEADILMNKFLKQ